MMVIKHSLMGSPYLVKPVNVCVFYYCRTYYKAVRVGGGDEQRPVWTSLPITHLSPFLVDL